MQDRARAIADEAARTVREAIDAANREAKAHSPSQKTRDLGHDLGDGLIYGMRDRRGEAKAEAERLIHIPRLNAMDDGGVTGNRARNGRNGGGNTTHITIEKVEVRDGRDLVRTLENWQRQVSVGASRGI